VALHSGAQNAVGVRNRNAREEGASVSVKSGQRTYHDDGPFERAGGKAVELDTGLLSNGNQGDVSLIDGDVHQHLGVIDDVRERITELQLPADESFNVRRRDYAVNGGTHLGTVEALLSARDLGGPVVGLGLLDAGFGVVVCGERAVHQRDRGLTLGLSGRQCKTIVPIFK